MLLVLSLVLSLRTLVKHYVILLAVGNVAMCEKIMN